MTKSMDKSRSPSIETGHPHGMKTDSGSYSIYVWTVNRWIWIIISGSVCLSIVLFKTFCTTSTWAQLYLQCALNASFQQSTCCGLFPQTV